MSKRKLPPSQRRDAEKQQKPDLMCYFSYWPLLGASPDLQPGHPIPPDQITNIAQILSGLPEVNVIGCIWTMSDEADGRTSPILLLEDKAREIYEHAKYWCMGRPQEFFQLELAHLPQEGQRPGKYYISLSPNLNASFQRLRANLLFESGVALGEDTRIQAIYRGLGTVAPDGAFSQIRDKVGPTCSVGFLDRAKLVGVEMMRGKSTPMQSFGQLPFDLEAVSSLDGVPVVWPEHLLQHLREHDADGSTE